MSDDTPTFAAGKHDTPISAPASTTPLDALRAEAKKEVRLEPLDLSVPNRPGWGMRFDLNVIDGDKMRHWTQQAVGGNRQQRRSRGGEIDLTEADQMKFAKTVIRATHRAFLYQMPGSEEWQVVIPEEGESPLSLQDEEFLTMVGAATPDEGLRIWYGSDGHVMQVASEIVEMAGYGEGDVNPLMAQ